MSCDCPLSPRKQLFNFTSVPRGERARVRGDFTFVLQLRVAINRSAPSSGLRPPSPPISGGEGTCGTLIWEDLLLDRAKHNFCADQMCAAGPERRSAGDQSPPWTSFFAAHLLRGNSPETILAAPWLNPALNSELLESCRDPILRSPCFTVSDDLQQHFCRVGNDLWSDNGSSAGQGGRQPDV